MKIQPGILAFLSLLAVSAPAFSGETADIFSGEKFQAAALARSIAVPETNPAKAEPSEKSARNSVDFNVGRVSISVDTRPARIKEMAVSLQCHFEGLTSGYPEKELAFDLREKTPGYYSLDISAGRIKDWSFSKDLKSCSYTLTLKMDSGAWGFVNLAGSRWNMTETELGKLLGDGNLAAGISAKYQPLVIKTKNGVVQGVNTTE